MKRGYPPVWLGILILTLVVFWRMAGAPVTVEEFGAVETPFWQMRVLAPARMARILRLWFSAPAEPRPVICFSGRMQRKKVCR